MNTTLLKGVFVPASGNLTDDGGGDSNNVNMGGSDMEERPKSPFDWRQVQVGRGSSDIFFPSLKIHPNAVKLLPPGCP